MSDAEDGPCRTRGTCQPAELARRGRAGDAKGSRAPTAPLNEATAQPNAEPQAPGPELWGQVRPSDMVLGTLRPPGRGCSPARTWACVPHGRATRRAGVPYE